MAQERVQPAPRGLMLLMALGPCLIWCGEYIGSGEVILATRTGAIYGAALLWVPAMAIFAKFWIGLAGAHYTVTTGECMIDMMGRMPGPRNWAIWPVFIGQVCSATISTAALASASGAFAGYFIPGVSSLWFAWLSLFVVVALVWSGAYENLKRVMSCLVATIIIGAFVVAIRTWPGTAEVLHGLFGFSIPQTPAWLNPGETPATPWKEILPLLGWAAGGFASQVWYSYWVLGAGYGMAHGRGYGQPADPAELAALSDEDIHRIRGWRRVVTLDALAAVVIGITVTAGFMIAGAGVLGPREIAPRGAEVALQLSHIFSDQWGNWGAHLFVLAGLAAMISTMMGQFAGWPRLLADCARLLFPPVARVEWKVQFRVILTLIAATNLVLILQLGKEPVYMVKTGAILDGLLLTPLQALAAGWVLYRVMPRFFHEEHRPLIKATPLIAAGLCFAFVMFTFVCVFKLSEMMGA